MKKHDQDKRISELIYGKLSPEEEKEIIDSLSESSMTIEEISSLRALDKQLGSLQTPGPSGKMDRRFYAMLNEEEKKALLGLPDRFERTGTAGILKWPALRIAAGVALFITGFVTATWIGNSSSGGHSQMAELSGEVKQLKETLVLSMMQQSSPVERIKAVNMVGDMDDPGKQVIDGLLNALNNDSNDNVRLLALDALVRYARLPEVRDGLVSSLSVQTSPLIQMRLTELMVALHEEKAVPEFRKMLEKDNLNYSVRGKINNAVGVLL